MSLQRPEEGVSAPEARVAGLCLSPNVGAGNCSQGPLEEQQAFSTTGSWTDWSSLNEYQAVNFQYKVKELRTPKKALIFTLQLKLHNPDPHIKVDYNSHVRKKFQTEDSGKDSTYKWCSFIDVLIFLASYN